MSAAAAATAAASDIFSAATFFLLPHIGIWKERGRKGADGERGRAPDGVKRALNHDQSASKLSAAASNVNYGVETARTTGTPPNQRNKPFLAASLLPSLIPSLPPLLLLFSLTTISTAAARAVATATSNEPD